MPAATLATCVEKWGGVVSWPNWLVPQHFRYVGGMFERFGQDEKKLS